MKINRAKDVAMLLYNDFSQVMQIIGCGVNKDGIIIYIYEKQINYLSILIDKYTGYNITYKFTDYAKIIYG